MSIVGTRVVRKEDPNLLTGRGTYTDNLKQSGMAHLAFVRSSEAHARLVSIDTSAAAQMPGVLGVWTAADFPDLPKFPAPPIPGLERPVLAIDRVRFVGESVAVVVAESRYQAADAAALVQVDYDPLPPVPTLEQAVDGSATELLFPDFGSNSIPVMPLDDAAAEAALAACPRRATLRVRNNRCAPVPMEPTSLVADWNGRGLTMTLTTQGAHAVRNTMSEVFGLAQHELRVVAPDVGGGFGARVAWYPEHYIAPLLSRKLGRPVKFTETRTENLLTMVQGRDQINDLEVGFDDSGKILVVKMLVHSNLGGYADPTGFGLPVLTCWMVSGCYDIPQVFAGATNHYTNQCPLGAYRGAGRPESAYAIERLVDLVADETGIDPVEVRRRNFVAADRFPYPVAHTGGGVNYDSGNYPGSLDKLLTLIDYPALLAEQKARLADPSKPLMGIGFSTWLEIAGFGPRGSLEGFGHLGSWESARVRIQPDGSAIISTGASPHGQGTYTTLAAVAADALGIDFDKITVNSGDTDNMPQGIGTMGSRTAPVAGSAVHVAATKVFDKAKRIAAHLLEAASDDIECNNGSFNVKGTPSKSVSWAEVGKAGFQGGSLPDDIPIGGLEELVFFEPSNFTFPAGAYCCVVAVDRETGKTTIEKFVCVDDCGTVINPLLAEGQVAGGVAQGIAQALYESVEYDPATGQPQTATLIDYLVPAASELPSYVLEHTVTLSPSNPLGVKGLGESGSVGATPAVTNAVVDALSHLGVRHTDMPHTPQRLWGLLSS